MGLMEFIFGNRAQRDQWRPSVMLKNLISPINSYGTCFACNGAGGRHLTCHVCNGAGHLHLRCRNCNGSGVFVRRGHAYAEKCRRCDGTGVYKPNCRRCGGEGGFWMACRRCGGSGWHRF